MFRSFARLGGLRGSCVGVGGSSGRWLLRMNGWRTTAGIGLARSFRFEGRTAASASALLATAAIITKIDQQDEQAPLKPQQGAETTETGLIQASIKSTQEERRRRIQRSRFRVLHYILTNLDKYLIDPLLTCLRFLQLTAMFVPVLVSLPMVLTGPRRPDFHNERWGAVLWYKYMTWTMELAGPSFIKLGQWAASRSDIFPQVCCNEMSKLHSTSKPHGLQATKRTIQQAFGGLQFDQIFDEFIETPLGVGAMGQVYKAKLNPNLFLNTTQDEEPEERRLFNIAPAHHHKSTPPSDWVVIKVLHPGVHQMVERDLRIIRFFANIVDWIPTMEWLSLPGEVAIFGQMMRSQLDLRIEADNLLIFRKHFKGKIDIKFPRPYSEYTSKEVLVEEFVSGIPMGTLLKNTTDQVLNPIEKAVSDKGLDAFLKMLLLDNFIHSDLHPGNIYVRLYNETKIDTTTSQDMDAVTDYLMSIRDSDTWHKELDRLYYEGYRPQLCFIDTGLVTELNKTNRRNFLDLFKAVSTFDGYKVGELMIERSRTPETALDPEIFALKVERLVYSIKQRTFALGSVRLGDLLFKVLAMVRQHHVRMEGDFITVVLSILLLEGIGRQLDPDMDLFKSSLPILRQLGPQERGEMLKRDKLSMAKVWIALEVRQFISASIQDIHTLVRYDLLCPNI